MQLRSLASLEDLEIVDCPKLKTLPRECLPRAPGRFSVTDTALLDQRRKECTPLINLFPPLLFLFSPNVFVWKTPIKFHVKGR